MALLDTVRNLLLRPAALAESAPTRDPQAREVALAVLLLKTAAADGHFAPAERAAAAAILQREFALPATDAEGLLAFAETADAQAVESYSFVRTVAGGRPYPERLRLLDLLLEVAAADGHLDGAEEQRVLKIAAALSISTVDYGRCKAAARARLRPAS